MKVFSASRRGNPSVSLVNQYKEGRMEGFVNAKRAVFYVRHSFINNRAIISIFSCKVFNRWHWRGEIFRGWSHVDCGNTVDVRDSIKKKYRDPKNNGRA